MSKKSTRKPKAKQPVPRSLPEIEADYGRFIAQAGQAQYQIDVYSEDLKRMNAQIRNLNYEAAARKSLDAEASKAATQPPPSTAEAVQQPTTGA